MSAGKREKLLKLDNTLVCKPLVSYNDILLFLENPPPWRALCKEMTPHSKQLIRNVEINKNSDVPSLEMPETFCHFNPDADDVKRHEARGLRKTLVCHDMANGYHEDCIIDGNSNYAGYTFYNWAGIDIFCYFSHHLVTIPPVGWINTGHAHGVKVIGTIITEWAEGIAFWDKVLSSETEYQNLASALVAIAKTLKLDGWLMNIENKISKPDVLLAFVQHFHSLLHSELEDPILVWYDSVTIQGNLNWQNGLTEKNKAFFDACDGFFTNYSWSVEDVTSSAVMAGERVIDLFIGMDVWGRNFFGGGQFNTQEAIKVAHQLGCSIAIFAPAWTYEELCTEKQEVSVVKMAEDLDFYGKFLLRDRALWGSIWPYLNTKVPCQMPFQTSFCRGQGKKRRLYGEVLSTSPWYNLRHQQYQPNAAHGPHRYLLTTEDTIQKVEKFKDKKGIIRYRPSFLGVSRQQSKDGSIVEEPIASRREEPETTEGNEADQKVAKKTKAKTTFIRNLFKQKTGKLEEDNISKSSLMEGKNELGPVVSAEFETGPSRSALDANWRSDDNLAGPSRSTDTMRMSINIRLRANPDKRRYLLAHVSSERECLELHLDDSFTGGSCLKVNPSDKLCSDHRNTRLFFCDFTCDDTLVFCVVTKTLRQYSDQTLNVKLFMKNAADEELTLVLTGRNVTQSTQMDRHSSGIKHVYPLNTASGDTFRELRAYLLLHEPGFYVPIENCFDWTVRYYQITVPGSRISSINLRTGLPQGGILLGHFGVCRRSQGPRT